MVGLGEKRAAKRSGRPKPVPLISAIRARGRRRSRGRTFGCGYGALAKGGGRVRSRTGSAEMASNPSFRVAVETGAGCDPTGPHQVGGLKKRLAVQAARR